jgi:hypothetical protein
MFELCFSSSRLVVLWLAVGAILGVEMWYGCLHPLQKLL